MMVLGVDPALGGGNATIACRLTQTRLYVCDLRVDYGLARTEQQLTVISEFASRYKPSKVILESDAQQKGLGNDERLRDLAALHGFEVVPHITRGEKADATFGVASMDRSFRAGEISIPWGDDETVKKMTPLVEQLRAWRPDVPTKRLTQDAVMALWFVWRWWMRLREQIDAPDPGASWRPSWMSRTPTPREILAVR